MPALKKDHSPKTLSELIHQSLLLDASKKAYWLDKVNGLDAVEAEGLLKIFQSGQEGFEETMVNLLGSDKGAKFWEAWKNFKKEKMHELSEKSHSKEAEKAEKDLEAKLK